MNDFNTALVREKLSITGESADTAVIVRSNRLLLPLSDRMNGETLVVRGQSMHITLRVAAKVFYSYHKNGLFSRRSETYDWQAMWDMVLTMHDRKYTPNTWVAIYLNGKPVFRTAEMPFMDVVEQCAARDVDDYDKAVRVAEATLSEASPSLRLEHLSKVGSIFHDDGKQLRCGIIHRADGRDATFNFSAGGGELFSRVPQGFNIAAAYLEAIDTRHYMRAMYKQVQAGTTTKNAPEMGKFYASPQRLRDLRKSLQSFEEHFDVKYRPEKPDVFTPPKEIPV